MGARHQWHVAEHDKASPYFSGAWINGTGNTQSERRSKPTFRLFIDNLFKPRWKIIPALVIHNRDMASEWNRTEHLCGVRDEWPALVIMREFVTRTEPAGLTCGKQNYRDFGRVNHGGGFLSSSYRMGKAPVGEASQ